MLDVGGLQGSNLDTDIPLTLHQENISARNESAVPNYRNHQARLDTFRNGWPQNCPVNPIDLANDGFIYTGSGDRVKCHFCDGDLFGWEPGDVVSEEHLKFQPNCPFKSGRLSRNITINSPVSSSYPGDSGYQSHLRRDSISMSSPNSQFSGEDVPPQIQNASDLQELLETQTSVSAMSSEHSSLSQPNEYPSSSLGIAPRISPKHPQYMLEVERLKTFATWPNHLKQTPESLAKAGFLYLGSGDKTKCFCCNGNLMNWEPDDDVCVEHARWFPDCGYIKLLKGDAFVSHVSSNNKTDLSALSPMVLAVVEQGYTREQIESTMERSNKSYDSFSNAESLLTFLLESDVEMSFRPDGVTEERVDDLLLDEASTNDRDDTPSLNKQRVLTDDEIKNLEEIESENHEMKDKLNCKICMEEKACIVFLPCGHLVTCGSCAAALKKCPLCRKSIQGTVRTYLG